MSANLLIEQVKFEIRKQAFVLDADGTLDSPAFWSGPKTPRSSRLGPELNKFRKVGYLTAVGTGAGRNRVIRLERELDHEFDAVGYSHGGGLEERNGHVEQAFLVPKEERTALSNIISRLRQIAIEHKGEVTDCEEGGACFSFHVRKHSFSSACQQVEPLLAGNAFLELKPTSRDGGVVIKAVRASKQLLVNHLHQQGCRMLIAAGDTEGDAEIIQAVIEDRGFPIVTRTEMGEPANKMLVDLVRQYGIGYIARDNEPHSYGLLAGFMAARAAGVINF